MKGLHTRLKTIYNKFTPSKTDLTKSSRKANIWKLFRDLLDVYNVNGDSEKWMADKPKLIDYTYILEGQNLSVENLSDKILRMHVKPDANGHFKILSESLKYLRGMIEKSEKLANFVVEPKEVMYMLMMSFFNFSAWIGFGLLVHFKDAMTFTFVNAYLVFPFLSLLLNRSVQKTTALMFTLASSGTIFYVMDKQCRESSESHLLTLSQHEAFEVHINLISLVCLLWNVPIFNRYLTIMGKVLFFLTVAYLKGLHMGYNTVTKWQSVELTVFLSAISLVLTKMMNIPRWLSLENSDVQKRIDFYRNVRQVLDTKYLND